MAIFNSYVKLPEGTSFPLPRNRWYKTIPDWRFAAFAAARSTSLQMAGPTQVNGSWKLRRWAFEQRKTATAALRWKHKS